MGRIKFLVRPPELSGNPTHSHLVTKQNELGKERINFASRRIFDHTLKGFLTCRKVLHHVSEGFTSPPKKVALRIFISPKIPSPSVVIGLANLGSNGKHASHYITEHD
jgi:hypothetical protein